MHLESGELTAQATLLSPLATRIAPSIISDIVTYLHRYLLHDAGFGVLPTFEGPRARRAVNYEKPRAVGLVGEIGSTTFLKYSHLEAVGVRSQETHSTGRAGTHPVGQGWPHDWPPACG